MQINLLVVLGWVGSGQSADGLGWIGSHKMDSWTTLIALLAPAAVLSSRWRYPSTQSWASCCLFQWCQTRQTFQTEPGPRPKFWPWNRFSPKVWFPDQNRDRHLETGLVSRLQRHLPFLLVPGGAASMVSFSKRRYHLVENLSTQ